MNNSLNEQVIKMYKDGYTKKSIKQKLSIGENKLKEILSEHIESVRVRALTMYDNEICRDGVKERICRELDVKMIDLEEWIRFRNFERKVKRLKLQQQSSKEDKRMRIQDGFSQWISYICEDWFKYRIQGRWSVK
jgi:hypothetical protein